MLDALGADSALLADVPISLATLCVESVKRGVERVLRVVEGESVVLGVDRVADGTMTSILLEGTGVDKPFS